MTGTASILSRTIAALTALLLAGGLFAWMNSTGEAVTRVSKTIRNNAAASQVFWSWIESVNPDASQTEAALAEPEVFQPETLAPVAESDSDLGGMVEEEAEEVENPFGCSHCGDYYAYWIDWSVWKGSLTTLFLFGALSAFIALNRSLLRPRPAQER